MRAGIIILFCVFLAGPVSAGLDLGDPAHDIEVEYAPGTNLKGWLNVSLSDEGGTNLFESSEGDTLTLISLLNTNADFSKTCEPVSCLTGYDFSADARTKTVALGSDDEAWVGFVLRGMVEGIEYVNFTVESDAGESCDSQIEIDFFNDGVYEQGNGNGSGNLFCQVDSGCYESGEEGERDFILNSEPYCQRVRFASGPGFEIGARIIESTTGSSKLIAEVYELSGASLDKGCEINKSGLVGGQGEIGCLVDMVVTEPKDYYVCLSTEGSGGRYKIKGYDDSEGCGFSGYPPRSESKAYDIYSKSQKFGRVNFQVGDTLSNGIDLKGQMHDYLVRNYKKQGDSVIDCTDGCVIPMKIASTATQNLIFKDLSLEYREEGLVESDSFYTLVEEASKISTAGYQRLYLSKGNFSVGEDVDRFDFSLEYDGGEILDEEINVLDVLRIESVSPSVTYGGFPTQFRARIDGNAAGSFSWEFGDGKSAASEGGNVTHTYNNTGVYEIMVRVEDNSGFFVEKNFTIDVVTPDEAINETIYRYKKDLTKFKGELDALADFYKDSVGEALDLSYVDSEIVAIEREYEAAKGGGDSGYISVMNRLVALDVPKGVAETESAKFTYYVDSDTVDFLALAKIDNRDYDSEKMAALEAGLASWSAASVSANVDFKEFSVIYDGYTMHAASVYSVSATINSETAPYVLVRNDSVLKFSDSGWKYEEMHYYKEVSGENLDFDFSVGEDVKFSDIPMFISPPIRELSVGGPGRFEEGTMNYLMLFFFLVLLLLVALFVYVILQSWYKKRYEGFLFKGNQLYNIMSFINQKKKEDKSDSEIRKELRRAGWSREQTAYALKKFKGKRTGMYEIPVKKIIKLKKKEEASKMKGMKRRPYRGARPGRRY